MVGAPQKRASDGAVHQGGSSAHNWPPEQPRKRPSELKSGASRVAGCSPQASELPRVLTQTQRSDMLTRTGYRTCPNLPPVACPGGLQRTGISPLTRPGARRHGRVGSRCASKAGHRHTIPPPSDGRLQQATATTTSAGRLLLVSLSPLPSRMESRTVRFWNIKSTHHRRVLSPYGYWPAFEPHSSPAGAVWRLRAPPAARGWGCPHL